MSSSIRYVKTDWTCTDPQCGNVNFARRDSCNRCGKSKPFEKKPKKIGKELGKSLAEKSKGLFAPEDWQCMTCGNVNWARRNNCNICNSSKFGKVEERTGLGGGYNERENVEYVEREESDNEYDEFGRIKKKFRGKILSTGGILEQKTAEESPTQKSPQSNDTNSDEENRSMGSNDETDEQTKILTDADDNVGGGDNKLTKNENHNEGKIISDFEKVTSNTTIITTNSQNSATNTSHKAEKIQSLESSRHDSKAIESDESDTTETADDDDEEDDEDGDLSKYQLDVDEEAASSADDAANSTSGSSSTADSSDDEGSKNQQSSTNSSSSGSESDDESSSRDSDNSHVVTGEADDRKPDKENGEQRTVVKRKDQNNPPNNHNTKVKKSAPTDDDISSAMVESDTTEDDQNNNEDSKSQEKLIKSAHKRLKTNQS